MSRRHKRKSGEDVELNLAAMLDMAFQLLTFFILTFKPAPIEGQISMRLPPPQAILAKVEGQKAGSDESNPNIPKGVSTLVISVFANPSGALAGLAVGEDPIATLPAFNGKLQTIFQDSANPFEQVIIQAVGALDYSELMKVVEICAAQRMPDGKPLSKLSFVELPMGN
jgi:biopolymer transport protein ExbD